MTQSNAIAWLKQLHAQVPTLRPEWQPRPYWSQKGASAAPAPETDLATTVTRVQATISDLTHQNWFARTLGYECVGGNGESDLAAEGLLDRRIGKAHLLTLAAEQWAVDDLCDYIEVFHDVAARPTRELFHSFANCGWHPTEYDRSSGQALYRSQINEVLRSSALHLRIADEGDDIGRMVRVQPGELETLVIEAADNGGAIDSGVPHAVALFRKPAATREERRSAVRELADVLESRRALLRSRLPRKDEGALFEIANGFGIRHRDAKQKTDYPDEYLDWLFYWYLATIDLVRRIT